MTKAQLLFLGTGGSAGVPLIGCKCGVCTSSCTKNQRLRSSALIKVGEKRFLIDAGPDFRTQALKFGVEHLDAVFLTHAHADHIAGLDDLRAYYFLTKKRLPCFLSPETLSEVRLRYHYFFTPVTGSKSISAQLDFHPLVQDFAEFEAEGVNFSYLTYFQNSMKVTGFRLGGLAYVSDIRQYSEQVIEALQGVDVLILSALRHSLSMMHFTVEEAINFARRVGAKSTYLTHVAHDLDHEAMQGTLPKDVQMSYDGLTIDFSVK